jgi:CRISPR-associated protein Cas2
MRLLLVYDISHDRTRTKIADICEDYGLDRIQYSAFLGQLSRVHQEELMEKIGDRLGEKEGKIQLFPICERDWDTRIEILPPDP